MEAKHKGKLRDNRTTIVKKMHSVPEVVDFLLQERVISAEFSEKVKGIGDRSSQVREIIDYIQGKTKGYIKFVEAMRKTENEAILDALEEELFSKQPKLLLIPAASPTAAIPAAAAPTNKEPEKHVEKTTPNEVAENRSNCYLMERNPRGYYLAIRVDTFPSDFKQSNEEDGNAFKTRMEKFKFYPAPPETNSLNPSSDEISSIIARFKEDCADDVEEAKDSAFIVVMSCGNGKDIFGSDGKAVDIQNKIIDPVSELLPGKPKIIIFVTRPRDQDGSTPIAPDSLPKDEELDIKKENQKDDMLILWTTNEGDKLCRDALKVSWFHTLMSVFADDAHDKSATEMLGILDTKVSPQKNSVFKRVSTLKKELHFNPGYSKKS